VLEVLAGEGKRFSELVAVIRKYFFSGEMNFTVPNGAQAVKEIRGAYPGGEVTDIDGVRIDFPDWWFNLRVSNTEPLLRLVVEAATEEGLEARRRELVAKIAAFTAAG